MSSVTLTLSRQVFDDLAELVSSGITSLNTQLDNSTESDEQSEAERRNLHRLADDGAWQVMNALDARKGPHDDLEFARLQGFYEFLIDGPDAGRTHATAQAWNEAYDRGRCEAEAFRSTRKTIANLRTQGYAVSVWTPEELKNGGASAEDLEDHVTRTGNELLDFK